MDVYSSAQFAQSGLNALSGAITNYGNQKHAEKMQEKDYNFNEQLAQNADARTRALYHDLYSPAAQIRQLKEAGLSPSIYASGGLAGKNGQSGAQGSGVSGKPIAAQAPIFAADIAQMALLKAQKEQIEAQTDNIKEDTKNKSKTSNLIDAQIIDTYANAGLKNAQEALTKVDTSLQQVSLNIASATETTQIQGIIDQMTSAFYESVIAQHEAERRGLLYKKETALFETEIAIKIAEYENLLMDLSVKTAGIELSQAQAHSLLQNVAIDWYNAGTNRMNAHTQYESLQAQIKQWAEQNNIALKELDRKKTEMWIDGACRIVGTLGNVACAALGAKSISNNQITDKTKSSTTYTDEYGNKHTVTNTNYKRKKD